MGAEGSKQVDGQQEQSTTQNPASNSTTLTPDLDVDKTRKIARNDEVVRNRVRSGFQYSMKVVIRGERSSGKTSLWQRLQGQNFPSEVDT